MARKKNRIYKRININIKLQQGGPTTEKLQRVDIYIADLDYCKEVYNKMGLRVSDTQVCANDQKSEKGSCHVSLSFLFLIAIPLH